MKSLFDEMGLEGITFVLISLILIAGFKFNTTWSLIIGLICAVAVYLIRLRGKK